MTSVLPAWSWQFARGHLPSVVALPTELPLTREWAWGGATGAGVKVAVIDSGVDGAHPMIRGVAGGITPRQQATVVATSTDGSTREFEVTVRIDGPAEVEYHRSGGILTMVLRQMLE